jgi:hypothetical protein
MSDDVKLLAEAWAARPDFAVNEAEHAAVELAEAYLVLASDHARAIEALETVADAVKAVQRFPPAHPRRSCFHVEASSPAALNLYTRHCDRE